MSALLEVEGLSVRYGNITAVHDLSFRVQAGEGVALIGANGAGKTSTLGALAGLHPPAGGVIRFAGQPIHRWPSHRIVDRGLVLVPEGRQVFGKMSVLENLQLGHLRAGGRVPLAQALERVFALFPRLAERRHQPAGTMSGGEQQMLAIARGLMSAPALLMLDEPCLGLSPKLVGTVAGLIDRLHAEGYSILLVEQNASLALEHSDRAYVLESGRLTLSGTGAELLDNPEVRRAYLGI